VGFLGGVCGFGAGDFSAAFALFAADRRKTPAKNKKPLYFLEELVYNNMHQGALGLVFAPKMQRRCR
jgi:hypothetical protein